MCIYCMLIYGGVPGEAAALWYKDAYSGDGGVGSCRGGFGEAGRKKKAKGKILSHIHTLYLRKTRQLARRRRRRRSMRRQRRLRCRRFFHPPLLSASPQIVKFLGNVLQLRLDGCQAFNLLLLHIYNERTARRLPRRKKNQTKQKRQNTQIGHSHLMHDSSGIL